MVCPLGNPSFFRNAFINWHTTIPSSFDNGCQSFGTIQVTLTLITQIDIWHSNKRRPHSDTFLNTKQNVNKQVCMFYLDAPRPRSNDLVVQYQGSLTKPWSSLVGGDEQLDWPNSQTTMELRHPSVA